MSQVHFITNHKIQGSNVVRYGNSSYALGCSIKKELLMEEEKPIECNTNFHLPKKFFVKYSNRFIVQSI